MFIVNVNKTFNTIGDHLSSLCKVEQSKLIFSIQIYKRTMWKNSHDYKMKSNDSEL
jgi:hypothetical protein